MIPKDTMVALMTDLYLASSSRNLKNIKLQKGVNYIPLVYAKYNIDSLRLKRSNFYYTSKIDEYQKLLEEVKLNLEEKRSIFSRQKKVRDSIRADSIRKTLSKVKVKPKNPTKKKGGSSLKDNLEKSKGKKN
ncbi:DUF4296 domain-containing protein [Flavobacteriaceae bacterium S356]|uniref:DUF4296 domain-containing protein n=1 Tax=Asprobacillus argus TaxID=3076534 RepID=A0ABU3LC48_9FLAO|nr:DUF4296 domain-containing protein [Flavobacteriaceae bacterium S356]